MRFKQEQQHLYDVMKQFETAMLVTTGANQRLHGRPMVVAQIDDAGDLWFITGWDTPKMEEIRTNEQVQVSFQDRNNRFISIDGRARMVRDPEKIAELWQESFHPWFPQGQTDPNIALIQVQIRYGELWDAKNMSHLACAFDAKGSARL